MKQVPMTSSLASNEAVSWQVVGFSPSHWHCCNSLTHTDIFACTDLYIECLTYTDTYTQCHLYNHSHIRILYKVFKVHWCTAGCLAAGFSYENKEFDDVASYIRVYKGMHLPAENTQTHRHCP